MRQSSPQLPLSPFDEIASLERLREAWHMVLLRGGGPGGDGETIADFARVADLRLERLSRELQLNFYRPGPLRHTGMPKKSGGTRPLDIPCVIDRVAQRAAADVLSRLLEPHFEDVSFGYRPGRSVQQAVARVATLRRQGYEWVVDGDIRCFFENVPHDMVLARLGAHVPDNRVIQLVSLWLESFADGGRGLAQGSPLSPLLSNLHLDAVDEAMDGSGARLVRFADDFLILAKTAPKAEVALDRMAKLLASHGLELNREKTRIVGFDQAFHFLGYLFVRSMVMPAEESEPRYWAGTPVAGMEELDEPAPNPSQPKIISDAATPSVISGAARRLIRRRPPDPLYPFEADRDADDFATGMAPLYILEPGRRLTIEGESFAVTEEGRRLVAIPAHLTGRIDLGPLVEAEDKALRLATAYRIPVHFLDGYGQPQGILLPPAVSDGALHLSQAQLVLDPERGLDHVRALVAGRLRNAQALLKRLNRRRKDEEVAKATEKLHYARRKTQHAASIDVARGIEGEGTATYWLALSRCFEHGWTFGKRLREGEKNAINAVLDWTASLLTRDVRAAVLRAGLHPGLGVLHAAGDNREACVYDLIEEFRAPLAEGLTIYLFNNRVLSQDDFGLRDGETRVVGQGGRKVITGYESWLARPVKNPRTHRYTNWRGMILLQARLLAKCVREKTAYEPYELDF